MFPSNFNALLEFNISASVDKEYLAFIEDLIRMIILQFIIQFMYFLRDPSNVSFFALEFLELIIYICIGVSVYWLIFKKLIKLT